MTARDKLGDAELMQHADGELAGEPAKVVAARLEQDPAARGKVATIGELGELIRGHVELSADAVPEAKLAAMWSAIEGKLAAPSPVTQPERSEPNRVRSVGMWGRLARWLEEYRGHIITGAISAGAVAALAIALRPSDSKSAAGAGAAANAGAVVTPAVYRPAEIESLDTPGGTGTVFNLADEDGSTTVIWVTPEDIVEGI